MGKLTRASLGVFSVAVVALCAFAILNRQNISDWLVLRNYQPSQEIEALSEKTTMTDYGRKLFYVYDPRLLNKTEFNSSCNVSEQTIVLGCYDATAIYLYDIADPRLNGVEEVTSAHEMLHAAYDRLSTKEKEDIDKQLEEFTKTITNARILKLINSYKSKDASNLDNELHSIIGTEIRDLTPSLEKYYGRYFSNRARVVDYSEQYEKVFTDLQDQVEKLDADLLLRKSQIESKEATLDSESDNLAAWKDRLDALALQNKTSEYNGEVPGYNAAVNAYNNHLKEVKDLIAEYNALVQTRNDLALQQNKLIDSLDSKSEAIQ